MTQDDVLRKLRKLLKLGESPNEHESAAAIGQAQRLMERHRITEAMLALDTEDERPAEPIRNWEEPLSREGRALWKGVLATVLCRANGCGCYKSGPHIRLYGRASAIERVRYLYAYCVAEIDRLADRYRGNGRTWLNNYRHGCVDAIRKAIQQERQAERDRFRRDAMSERALVRVDSALARIDAERHEVEAWGKRTLRLRTAVSSGWSGDASAREQGRSDGRGIYPSGRRAGIGTGTRRIGAGR